MRTIARLPGLAAAATLSAVLHGAAPLDAPLDDATPLEPGRLVSGELAAGSVRRYAIDLTAGQYLRVVVEQRGVDVVAELGAPGAVIVEFQQELRPRGDEPVEIVATASGRYTIDLHVAPGTIAAGAYSIRAGEVRVATDVDRALQQSRVERMSALRLERAGRFAEARTGFERALHVAEGVAAADEPAIVALIGDLAGNALERHDNLDAGVLYERALAALERTAGPDDPRTAMVRSRLGLVYQRRGERPKAEALVRQALTVLRRELGPDHSWVVRCLVTLGNLRNDAGDLEEAAAVGREGLGMLERLQQAGTIAYADLLNNLGDVYRQQGHYARAEELMRRSLDIGERLRGANSLYVATALQNLGIVARERKAYPQALDYSRRALAIREAALGPDHPEVAQLLNNLANVYRASGDDERALDTHLRAFQIWETSAGPYERGTLLSAGNLARTYMLRGDVANAVRYERRADEILERQLTLNLAVGSERQRLAFAAAAAERTDRTMSLHLLAAPGDREAASLAATVVLQRKGRVTDAMSETAGAVRDGDAGIRDLVEQLQDVRARLARLALGPPGERSPAERARAIAALDARQEEIEIELAEQSAAYRITPRTVTLEAVQAAIPDEAALVEYSIFRPFDPKAERNAEAYGPPRYAAYVIRRRGIPVGFDLGTATAIDEAVDALRRGLRDSHSDLHDRARQLHELALAPLRTVLGDATRLLISPDGRLSLVPFEAFVDAEDRYLVERYDTTYLTSGRDLLRLQVPRPAPGRVVIFANPLFGAAAASRMAGRSSLPRITPTARSIVAGDDRSSVYFAPLGATAEEGRAMADLFPDATLLTGSRASKRELQQVRAPAVLHIATHGFFLSDPAGQAATNPLLRSGLALAGANERGGPQDDGILTALEASGLNLWGTKLVTLSACDTGVGEVRNGDGVYGLRRSFVLAGTESLVMSLWPVSDSVARATMVAYYRGLRDGLGRSEALRAAKRALLEQPKRRHPYYWASFIQSGEWANLEGRR